MARTAPNQACVPAAAADRGRRREAPAGLRRPAPDHPRAPPTRGHARRVGLLVRREPLHPHPRHRRSAAPARRAGLHRDGAATVALSLNGRIYVDDSEEAQTYTAEPGDVVHPLLCALPFLAEHARDRAAARGPAHARVTLVSDMAAHTTQSRVLDLDRSAIVPFRVDRIDPTTGRPLPSRSAPAPTPPPTPASSWTTLPTAAAIRTATRSSPTSPPTPTESDKNSGIWVRKSFGKL